MKMAQISKEAILCLLADTNYHSIEQIGFLVGNDPNITLEKSSIGFKRYLKSCLSKERIPSFENGEGWVLELGIAALSEKPSGATRLQTTLIRALCDREQAASLERSRAVRA